MKRKHHFNRGRAAGLIFTVVLVSVIGLWLHQRDTGLLPQAVRRQASSVLYVPTSETEATIARSSAKYDTEAKIISYTAGYRHAELAFTEQPTPEAFADIPDVYPKLIAGMHQYSQFDAEPGTVYLTKPDMVSGHQVAVMNAKGTLLFVTAKSTLETDDWHYLFNHLQLIR